MSCAVSDEHVARFCYDACGEIIMLQCKGRGFAVDVKFYVLLTAILPSVSEKKQIVLKFISLIWIIFVSELVSHRHTQTL
jgi:hypothetical protein